LLAIPVTEEEEEYSEFQPWLQKKLALNTSASWAKIILFYSTDESQSILYFRFYILYFIF